MKNSNIPIYRRKKEILNKNTLINPNEESENKKLESENKPIIISLDNNLIIDDKNDNFPLEYKEKLTSIDLIENLNSSLRKNDPILIDLSSDENFNLINIENYLNYTKSKRNSHSSINTLGTNIHQNSISTNDSPLKPFDESKGFKRKKDMSNYKEKDLNNELPILKNSRNSFILNSTREIQNIKDIYKHKELESLKNEEFKYNEKMELLKSENFTLIESLKKENDRLRNHYNKLSELSFPIDDHKKEIDQMKTIFNLKKKYILEKIKYFQILLIEKKENNILSKETRKNEKNGLNINKNYKSNMENDLNNNLKSKFIPVDQSLKDFFQNCYQTENDNKIGIIQNFTKFYKK